jgi:iron complex transport system ATP-binding protein
MPALQLVLLGLFPHKPLLSFTSSDDIAKAKAALDKVGFRPSEKQPMGRLSGGERQLVWLAQGLLQDGPIWLLDEPTQHLDAARRGHLFSLLERLVIDFGKILLVATHELENLVRIPSATHLDLLRPEEGFVPCTETEIAQTLANHRVASGLF